MDSVRNIRRQRGLSQDELSEIAGVSQKSISEIELGKVEPRPSTLRRLARGLGVSVADFFIEEAPPLGEAPLGALERLQAASPGQIRRLLAGYGPEWSAGRIVEARGVADKLGVSYEELRALLIEASPLQAKRLLLGPEEPQTAQDEALRLYVGLQREAVEAGRLSEAELGHNVSAFVAA